MKKMALMFLLLQTTLLLAASAAPNPADFPLSLHVAASRLVPNGAGSAQELDVIAGGIKYELMGNALSNSGKGIRVLHVGLIPVGDYKAKLVKADYKPDYLLFLSYEILLPDGTSATFSVVGETE
jgi:hypothetical protein